MAAIILCAKNEIYIKRWSENLKSAGLTYSIKRAKSEVFEYLNIQKTPTLLVLEAGFIDNEEFFALLKRRYPWVKVLIFSSEYTPKEAKIYIKHEVKSYVNVYINPSLVKGIVKNIEDDRYWFNPKYLTVVQEEDTDKIKKEIGLVKRVKNSVLIKNNKEEIVAVNQKLYIDDIIIISEENGLITFDIGSEEEITIAGVGKIYLEESILKNEGLNEKYIMTKKQIDKFLSSKHENNFVLDKKDKKNGMIARYVGKLSEYNIYPSKNIDTFFVISDKLPNRDGSDLVGASIDRFIFADDEVAYDGLCSIKNYT